MLLPPKDVTLLLFVFALTLYLTPPTVSSCLLYAAVTAFLVLPVRTSVVALLGAELLFGTCVIYVFYTSTGAGYAIPLLGTAVGLYSDCLDG